MWQKNYLDKIFPVCLWALPFVLMLASIFSYAEAPQVLATVDRNEVQVGETFTFKITVTSDSSLNVERPQLGNIAGLELINTWTAQNTQSLVVGGQFQVVNSKEFRFMFAASRIGKIQIPSLPVIVEGQTYTTEPITLQVSATAPNQSGQGSPDPFPSDDPMDQMDQMFNQFLQRRFGGQPGRPLQDTTPVNPKEAFFLRAEADKSTAYVGEQVTASWYLYTRGQILDIDTLKYPDLKGFWKEELQMATKLDFEQVVLNGIPYQRALLVSYALFPIKAGSAKIDSYKAKCTVVTSGNFGFGRSYQFAKSSRPLDLKVLDLPKESRPRDFTGAVGVFQLKSELDRKEVPAHQPVSLKIRVEGRGNAKLVDLPPLNLPPSVELYDQTSDSRFFKNGTSFKEFEILLIPRETGQIDIPPIQISTFNPEKKSFEQISTGPLTLTVTEGQGPSTAPMAKNGDPSQQKKTEAVSPYPFFSTVEKARGNFRLPSFVWWALFSVASLSVMAHAFVALGRTRKKENLKQILQSRLKSLRKKKARNEWRNFGVELINSTYKILGLVVGAQAASHDLENLLRLGPPSLRRDLGDSLRQFLSQSEVLAFAPEELAQKSSSAENLTKLYAEFDRLMKASIQKVEDD